MYVSVYILVYIVYMYIWYGRFISLIRVVASDSLRSTSRSTRGVVASKAHNAVYCTRTYTYCLFSICDLFVHTHLWCNRRGRAGNRKQPRESRVRGADLLKPVAISFSRNSPIAGTLVPEQLMGVGFSLTLFYGMNCSWYVQIRSHSHV